MSEALPHNSGTMFSPTRTGGGGAAVGGGDAAATAGGDGEGGGGGGLHTQGKQAKYGVVRWSLCTSCPTRQPVANAQRASSAGYLGDGGGGGGGGGLGEGGGGGLGLGGGGLGLQPQRKHNRGHT